jgi:hypothetical protein
MKCVRIEKIFDLNLNLGEILRSFEIPACIKKFKEIRFAHDTPK